MFDLPAELTLWLLGLDIGITFNPPRRPQDNGVIERSQGTGKRWAEPGTCVNANELQRRLQTKSRPGKSTDRAFAPPGAAANPRGLVARPGGPARWHGWTFFLAWQS
jgi:hypothetical protein